MEGIAIPFLEFRLIAPMKGAAHFDTAAMPSACSFRGCLLATALYNFWRSAADHPINSLWPKVQDYTTYQGWWLFKILILLSPRAIGA
jgi:hypothetical protein